jgi:hypothetical protein
MQARYAESVKCQSHWRGCSFLKGRRGRCSCQAILRPDGASVRRSGLYIFRGIRAARRIDHNAGRRLVAPKIDAACHRCRNEEQEHHNQRGWWHRCSF